MKCPSCKKDALKAGFLEDGLRSHRCRLCHGDWFLVEDFVAWQERSDAELSEAAAEYELEDSRGAMLCPMTGTIMQKYRISNDTEHKLDYSPPVGGVWLDAGEWQYLKERSLAHQVNSILTDQWQRRLREDNAALTFTALYEKKFGAEDYAKVREIRTWLSENRNKAELRRYLLADDPYKV